MKNRAFLLTILVVSILCVAGFYALAQPQPVTSSESLESVLQQIRQSQGAGPQGKIDCGKVTDAQLERLGEAWMNIAHPDSREHEWMEQMMGGEGSQSLAAMHRLMGARYLGCTLSGPVGGAGGMWNYGPGGMMGYGSGAMMGYNPDGSAPYGGAGMMGYSAPAAQGHRGNGTGNPAQQYGYPGDGMYDHMWDSRWYGGWFMWIVMIGGTIIFFGIIAGVIYLIVKGAQPKSHGTYYRTTSTEMPLDVLKKRYAKGEISKEDFDRMKRDLGL